MESEVSVLLIVTVVVGTILITSLMACYICVFRQLCCSHELDKTRNGSFMRRNSKRNYTLTKRDSINMGELTHVSVSQHTDTEKI